MPQGVVDLEVYQGSTQVYQKYWEGSSFAPATAVQTFQGSFSPAASGELRVTVGVFVGYWSPLVHWNDNAARIVVSNPAAPAFSLAVVAAPSSARVGAPVTITASLALTSGAFRNGIFDMEVYSSSGAKINQQWMEGVVLAQAGATLTHSWSWTPTTAGTFAIDLGVFNSDWTQNLAWEDHAATVVVLAPSK